MVKVVVVALVLVVVEVVGMCRRVGRTAVMVIGERRPSVVPAAATDHVFDRAETALQSLVLAVPR